MTSDTSMPPAAPAGARGAATAKEKSMWMVDKLAPDTAANNIGVALQVGGRLRPDALQAAMAIVLGQYEALRTVFFESGADLFKQVVPAGESGVEIEVLDLSGGRPEQDLATFVNRPFRFDGRPLARIATAGHPDGDILCVAVHHLVFDMTSAVLFLQAFLAAYDAIAAGRPMPAPPAGATLTETGPKPADLAYWRETLSGITLGELDLWCGLPRGRRPAMTGESVGHVLSPEAQRAVQQLQRTARAPIAAILLAGYVALLAAHGAGPDLVVGSPVDVRGSRESAIGNHANVVPLRVTVDFAEGFRALVRKARDAFLGAMAHPTSVDDLAGVAAGVEQSWQRPLFRHLFNFLPEMAVDELTVAGLPARLLPIESPHSKYDLELVGRPSGGELLFRYSREIFSRADVEALLHRFDALLVAAAEDPDRPLSEMAGWSALDRRAVDRANDTTGRPPHPVVPEAFAEHAANAPRAAAVAEGDRVLSYQDVHEQADAVRALLADAGVQVGDVVATAVSRAEQAAAALGVWRAGAVLLPLDPGHDPAWLGRRIEQAQPAAVLIGAGIDLADIRLTRFLPGDLAGLDLPVVLSMETAPAPGTTAPGDVAPIDPTVPACLFHDCGDDGQPVPRVLSHAGLADSAGHFAAELGVAPGTGLLSLAGPATSDAILDLGLALSAGAELVFAPEQARTGGADLRAAVDRHGASVVLVPSGIPARILEDLGDRLPGLTALVYAGEVARATAGRLLAAGCRLCCVDGIEGTTGRALSGPVDTVDRAPRLAPITRMRALVTTPDGRELPVGVRGELRLTGTGLTDDTPDDPASAVDERYGRCLRSGVQARWRPDATIELLGRTSRQAATPDGPADLGEVEAVLLDHAGVTGAIALAVVRPDDTRAIIAFVEHPGAQHPGTDLARKLLAHAASGLDAPAVPRRVVLLDMLPRAVDGRPDRIALERLAEKALGEAPAPDPADDDPLCADLIGLWRSLLPDAEVTARTHFFESGGHSLAAAVLADRVQELTGTSLELKEIFEHPTPAALAARLRG
ncbi:condensation domain-containing protein [Streptomyces canus]|uniref:condensation domain-containing protein n=1 Tax=Streptomyces canus TaxID=58343 RepID=UPI002259337F|nr:condensation domain-containing protein [Streptomyces canus]MCX4852221.1 condensation domain-containing protein [Streptomyces canus]